MNNIEHSNPINWLLCDDPPALIIWYYSDWQDIKESHKYKYIMDKTLLPPQHSLDFTVSSHLPIIGLYVFQIRVEFYI